MEPAITLEASATATCAVEVISVVSDEVDPEEARSPNCHEKLLPVALALAVEEPQMQAFQVPYRKALSPDMFVEHYKTQRAFGY